MIFAHEANLSDRIRCERSAASTTSPVLEIMSYNPLSKIPTLILDDGGAIFDSRVICEYLDTLHNGNKLFPDSSTQRVIALKRQALGDGLLDLLLLWRVETRDRSNPSSLHMKNWQTRTHAVLDSLEAEAGFLQNCRLDIGHISIGCALSYLDFRFDMEQWRRGRPQLSQWHSTFEARKSVIATAPPLN